MTVRFTYDINGALQVEVKVDSTGKLQSRIFRNALGLSDNELKKRFEALGSIKLSPRDQIENRALLARADRLYAEGRGAERDALRQLTLAFERAIADQRARDLAPVRAEFSSVLDRLEHSVFGGA